MYIYIYIHLHIHVHVKQGGSGSISIYQFRTYYFHTAGPLLRLLQSSYFHFFKIAFFFLKGVPFFLFHSSREVGPPKWWRTPKPWQHIWWRSFSLPSPACSFDFTLSCGSFRSPLSGCSSLPVTSLAFGLQWAVLGAFVQTRVAWSRVGDRQQHMRALFPQLLSHSNTPYSIRPQCAVDVLGRQSLAEAEITFPFHWGYKNDILNAKS